MEFDIKKISLSRDNNFRSIKNLIKKKICFYSKKNWKQSCNLISEGWNIDLRKDLEFMNKIEYFLKKIYKPYFKKLGIQSLQFPVNIRLVGINKNKLNKNHAYSTENLHSDVWSGAPADIYNFFLYIFVDKDGSYLDIFKVKQNIDKYSNFRGSYKDININKSDIEYFEFKKISGNSIIFNPFSPHKTVKTTKGFRISIDFRARTNSCYTLNNKFVKKKDFLLSEPGNPYGLGHYWTYTNKSHKRLKDKYNFELNYSKSVSEKAFTYRNLHIDKVLSK